ncbi:MAG: hypothetical protein JWO09_2682 [Bacteroidetes bacterium]|nr:hypothetical protein [Bacteroidota bacterium]
MIFMKKLLLLFIFCFPAVAFSQPGCSYNNRSSFFGERSVQLSPAPANTARIFMDKSGYYYPEIFIPDAELENNCSSLKEWYKSNEKKLSQLCERYKVSNALPVDEKIEALDDSIAASYIAMINEKAKLFRSVDVLIHGFRKRAYGKKDKVSTYSIDDYQSFENVLPKEAGSVLFVEVYWDSKFITPISSYKYKGFELFEQAGIPNAEHVGLQLRKVIPSIQCDHINIITHSLGAKAGCELLFNASKGALANESTLACPAQKDIRLCLIEPAISPDVFNEYYSRTGVFDYKAKDRYRLGIVYNENDFVLLKSYNFGAVHIISSPLEYGNTALGCNYKGCIPALKQLFTEKYPNSVLYEPFDFSSLGSDHRLYRYCVSEKFTKVNEFLNME